MNESKDNNKEKNQRKRTFNKLTAKEWASLSRNVWNDLSSPREKHHLDHGAVYPLKLAKRIITIYSKEGDLVFDPFVGTGTTVIAAYKLNRSGLGIELVDKYAKVAKKWLVESRSNLFDNQNNKSNIYEIIHDDCRNMKQYVKRESVQLTFTSPPYANFIHKSIEDRKKTHKKSKIVIDNKSTVKKYSDKKEDFGNLNYDKFLVEIRSILKKNYDVTKPGGYSVWLVKDYRDTENGIPYIPFHSDLAKVGKKAGWLYHDLILWDQNEQRKLILLGYPTRFYTNQNCSFLIVFRKPEND